MDRAFAFAALIVAAAVLPTTGLPASLVICRNPDWKQRPTREQLFDVWPREAFEKGLNGKAEITCTASTQGALSDCTVTSEQPPGAGFGQAAIALTPQFLMFPKVCDGRPMESTVNIPINFSGLHGPTITGSSRIPGEAVSQENAPLIIDRPAWIEAPTYAQMVAAYPVAARGDKVAGHVALACDFGAGGRLTHCRIISEVPSGRGFGGAAKTLSRYFIAPDPDAAGRKMRDNTTVLAFTFDPGMLDGHAPIIGKPQWTHVPKSVDLAAGFPTAAAAAHIAVGHVALACDVGPGGRLVNCAVSRQSPEGLGFDKAALALSTIFQVTVWTDEGLPTVGGHVVVPIRYEAPSDAVSGSAGSAGR